MRSYRVLKLRSSVFILGYQVHQALRASGYARVPRVGVQASNHHRSLKGISESRTSTSTSTSTLFQDRIPITITHRRPQTTSNHHRFLEEISESRTSTSTRSACQDRTQSQSLIEDPKYPEYEVCPLPIPVTPQTDTKVSRVNSQRHFTTG